MRRVELITGVKVTPVDPPRPAPRPAPSAPEPPLDRLARSIDRARPATEERSRIRAPLLVAWGLLAAVSLAGLPYYLLSAGGRVRSPLHAWFRSSGYVGQSAGIVAFLLFAFIWLYPLRKRVRWLSFTGAMGRWLDWHIVAGLTLPVLGAIHAAWNFKGLIGLGYAAMLVVCLSGVVGKYIYTRIPRSRNGIELTLDELSGTREALLERIAAGSGLSVEVVRERLRAGGIDERRGGLGRTLARMVADDLARWRAARGFARTLRRGGAERAAVARLSRLARRELALAQQARMLDASRALFRFWHVAHLPFAVTALVAVVVHVAVVVALGTTWLW